MSQILTVFSHLGVKFNLFNPLGFEGKREFDHKTSKIKSHSIRALKRHLNHKSPIHVREITSIFQFSAESYESDLSVILG